MYFLLLLAFSVILYFLCQGLTVCDTTCMSDGSGCCYAWEIQHCGMKPIYCRMILTTTTASEKKKAREIKTKESTNKITRNNYWEPAHENPIQTIHKQKQTNKNPKTSKRTNKHIQKLNSKQK